MYQLSLNKLARMQNNGASKNKIDAQIEEVDLKYKNCIAGRTLNELENEFHNEAKLKLELSRLEQEDILDEAAIAHTKEALAVSKVTSEKLLNVFDVHNDKGMRASIRSKKEALDLQVEQIKAQEIKANQSIKNYSAQATTCQDAQAKLFNLKQNKASKVDIQKAEAEVKNEREKLDTLLVEVGVCADATVVEQLREMQQKIDSDFAETQAKITLANLSLDKFNWAAKHKITEIFGDYQADRSVYAKRATDFIIDLKDPSNEWSPEKRQVEYDRIYKDIYNDVLYSFETRGPQRREFCRNKLHKYLFNEVKGCKPPLPDKQIDTWAKYFVNEAFYTFFKCEPFQDVAQHTDVAINARFFITTAIGIGTFGAASAAGMAMNVGLGAGSAGLGVGAAIGGDKSDTFKAFGEGANGFQMSFNQPVEVLQLGKPNLGMNDAFSKAPQAGATINIPFNPEYLPYPFSQKAPITQFEPYQPNLTPFNQFEALPTFSMEEVFKANAYKSGFSIEDICDSERKSQEKKEKAKIDAKADRNREKEEKAQKDIKAPVQIWKKVLNKKDTGENSKNYKKTDEKKKPGADKKLDNQGNKNKNKRNYNAELYALNNGIPNESTQAGIGVSALYYAGKNIVESTIDIVKTVGEFSKNMQSGPEGVAKANETVRGGIQTAKTTADMLANPKKTWNAIGNKANELVESAGQHLEEGNAIAAGKDLAPFVEAALNVGLLAGPSLSSFSLFTLFESSPIQKTANFSQIIINSKKPVEIFYGYGDLSVRQTNLLGQVSRFDDIKLLGKSDVTVTDLAALTAKTGDEFAMFTLGSKRMIIRGNNRGVDISHFLSKLQNENWKWSAHTHPGIRDIALNASGIPGDRQVLKVLEQERSLILNSAGRRNVFDRENDMHISSRVVNKKIKINFRG